ncbi:MAG: hypothetical protein MZV63_59660 [Marinilabiliales bacterium]|nr:hypothetical protein [Marinilabiliales bacterium]
MKFIPIRVDIRSRKYSWILSLFSGLPSHVYDCIRTMRVPMFRIFFIKVVVPPARYIPPKRVPSGAGSIPIAVTSAKRTIPKLLNFSFLSIIGENLCHKDYQKGQSQNQLVAHHQKVFKTHFAGRLIIFHVIHYYYISLFTIGMMLSLIMPDKP